MRSFHTVTIRHLSTDFWWSGSNSALFPLPSKVGIEPVKLPVLLHGFLQESLWGESPSRLFSAQASDDILPQLHGWEATIQSDFRQWPQSNPKVQWTIQPIQTQDLNTTLCRIVASLQQYKYTVVFLWLQTIQTLSLKQALLWKKIPSNLN